MTFGQKLQLLRRERDWTQEQLAERIHISRQAVSKWEADAALPDTENVVRLSRLFGVTTDFLLLNGVDAPSEPAQAPAAEVPSHNQRIAFAFCLAGLGLGLIWGLIACLVNKSVVMAAVAFTVQAMSLAVFEAVYRRHKTLTCARRVRARYYQIALWLAAYLPARVLSVTLWGFYPRPYHALLPELTALAVYVLLCLWGGRRLARWEQT